MRICWAAKLQIGLIVRKPIPSKIPHGILNGISFLLSLNSGNSITDYFSTVNDPNAIIMVAGHSLGGALSRALILFVPRLFIPKYLHGPKAKTGQQEPMHSQARM
ncbi:MULTISPECIES: hypothetical protein [Chryseobacterium]|nr:MULTISPECIES: hypothetical protein [Chryseobacterium]